jgi:hypothetical protein
MGLRSREEHNLQQQNTIKGGGWQSGYVTFPQPEGPG